VTVTSYRVMNTTGTHTTNKNHYLCCVYELAPSTEDIRATTYRTYNDHEEQYSPENRTKQTRRLRGCAPPPTSRDYPLPCSSECGVFDRISEAGA
jgi:hypothetical protein